MSSPHSDTASTAHGPLQGLTVVELGHSVAAPFGGRILADLGAKVLKIENPDKGDDARQWGPPFWDGLSVAFGAINSNKLSVTVDIKNDAERGRLRDFIVADADVVLQNLRPGLAEKMGLGPSLRMQSPKLIYCNMSAFGAKGPLRQRPGYDPLMQAFGGIMSITGEEGRPPVRVGPSIVDMSTGMWAVIGILSALHRRTETGIGCEIDTSLYESTLAWVGSAASGYLATGKLPIRRGTEMPYLAPYKVYEAADGYILIAAGNDNVFRRLAEALGRPEWASDIRFATNPERVRNRELVNAAVQEAVSNIPRSELVIMLDRASVPCAGLQTLDEVLEHPQTKALDILQQCPESERAFIGLPISFDGIRPPMRNGPPELGANCEALFGESRADSKIQEAS